MSTEFKIIFINANTYRDQNKQIKGTGINNFDNLVSGAPQPAPETEIPDIVIDVVVVEGIDYALVAPEHVVVEIGVVAVAVLQFEDREI